MVAECKKLLENEEFTCVNAVCGYHSRTNHLTALQIAIYQENMEIVRLLLGSDRFTALDFICPAFKPNRTGGATGRVNALLQAVSQGKPEIVRLILQEPRFTGHDTLDDRGGSVLHFCAL